MENYKFYPQEIILSIGDDKQRCSGNTKDWIRPQIFVYQIGLLNKNLNSYATHALHYWILRTPGKVERLLIYRSTGLLSGKSRCYFFLSDHTRTVIKRVSRHFNISSFGVYGNVCQRCWSVNQTLLLDDGLHFFLKRRVVKIDGQIIWGVCGFTWRPRSRNKLGFVVACR